MYRITVSSDFEQLWRYNIFAACEGFDSADESLYVVGSESISSEEIQSGIPAVAIEPPVVFSPESMTLELECPAATRIEAEIYVVAHTLPDDRVVENSPPFDLVIEIVREDEMVYRNSHKVNQWGGVSININI